MGLTDEEKNLRAAWLASQISLWYVLVLYVCVYSKKKFLFLLLLKLLVSLLIFHSVST